jgi:hypothetical protein
MSVTKCADKEVEECYDRGCGGDTLDQRVLIDSRSRRRVIGAAKSEQGSVQQNINCVIEAAVFMLACAKSSDTGNILECDDMRRRSQLW